MRTKQKESVFILKKRVFGRFDVKSITSNKIEDYS